MTLDAEIGVRRDRFELDVTLTVEPGELVAVLGPNGAGKSTLLRCLAGLVPIDRGSISIDGNVLDDPSAGVFLPPERRSTGVVFQDYLLFPNLTALENVAFALRAAGTSRRAARDEAMSWLERVDLADHAGHRPAQLSGGQAQRVALARALVRNPRVLLLDEPLAALDVSARGEVRRDLRRHLAAFAGMRLLVTHDPVDAYILADRVMILEDGSVTQDGPLAAVTAHPRSAYVADLVGLNLVAGELRQRTLRTPAGGAVVAADAIGDGPAFAAVHPHAVALHRRQPEGSARNVWQVTVRDVDLHHDRARVLLDGPVPLVAEVTPAALTDLAIRPGDSIWASVKATEVTVYAR